LIRFIYLRKARLLRETLVPFRIFPHRSKKTSFDARNELVIALAIIRCVRYAACYLIRATKSDSIRSARSHIANSILSFMSNGNVHACTHARGVARGSVCVNYLSIIERSFLQPRPEYLCCCGLVCRFNCYEIYTSRSS